ncbi:MAG TPA: DoxX family protein [Vicinamibacterales bacterium]|nr:DoxX family protein [Vicinamibacterales bacterium]
MTSSRSLHLGEFAARVLVVPIFVTSGIGKLTAWNSNVAYMATRQLPAIRLLLATAALIELIGSVCVISGVRLRTAAIVLGVYLVIVTCTFHDFWNVSGMNASMQRTQFLENVAIVGGLLHIAFTRRAS